MDQKIIREQSVSLLINELGFSSCPHVEIREIKSCIPAGSFLHPLVAIQDPFEKLSH